MKRLGDCRPVALVSQASRLRAIAKLVANIRGTPEDRNAEHEALADDLIDVADKITVTALRRE